MRRMSLVCFVLSVLSLVLVHCKGQSCQVLCNQGATYCEAGGIRTCTMNPNTGCFDWVFTTCPAQQSCVSTPAPAKCSAAASCNQIYAKKKCVGNDVYYFDNCDQQREKHAVCPAHAPCKDGRCDDGTACGTPECVTKGQKQCTETGWFKVCKEDEKGCLVWSEPLACNRGFICDSSQGNTCVKGECKKTCVTGEKRCDTSGGVDKVQTCVTDDLGCPNWGPLYPCPAEHSCREGVCQKLTCPSTCQITSDCKLSDCGERTACEGNKCVKAEKCTDKCKADETRCIEKDNEQQLQVCITESHGCLDWSAPRRCLVGQSCQGGECKVDPCPTSCQTDNDCNKTACGAKKKCVQGKCDVAPPSPETSTEPTTEPMSDAGTTEASPELPPEPSPTGWKYGKNTQFQTYPPANSKSNAAWSSTYRDVINHEPASASITKTDVAERTSEAMFYINGDLKAKNPITGKQTVALYVLSNRFVVLTEPGGNVKLSGVAAYVPKGKFSQTTLYQSHVTGSTIWETKPLSLLYDEWITRSIVLFVALAQQSSNLSTGKSPTLRPTEALEFMVFSLALLQLIDKEAPTYLTANKNVLEFTAWFAGEVMSRFRTALTKQTFQSSQATALHNELKTGANAKPLRDFCARTFGQKWVDQVILGKP